MKNEEDFTHLLLHNEVRCLPKGACLERLNYLLNSVLEFLKEKDAVLQGNELNLIKAHLSYPSRFFGKEILCETNSVNFLASN